MIGLQRKLYRSNRIVLCERLCRQNMSSKLQEHLLNLSNYKQEWVYTDNEQEEIKLHYTTLQHDSKTIIATYSAKRAKKDKYDRNAKMIEFVSI